jgi:heme/copper-type cytochrome/quinol oxidase subunit 2
MTNALKSLNFKLFLGFTLILILFYSNIFVQSASGINLNKNDLNDNYEQLEIHLTATSYEFSPNRIIVPLNVNLTLILHAEDKIHGFWLDSYNLEQTMCNDHVFKLSFITYKAGSFKFRCSEPACGPYHPYMTGVLKVEDDSTLFFNIGIVIFGFSIIGVITFKRRGISDVKAEAN